MMMNPEKAEQYQNSVERTKQDIRWRRSLSLTVRYSITLYLCRSIYDKIDLDKSYEYLFELLWYSQIPCFDILNITTKLDQEHGEKNVNKYIYSFLLFRAFRDDKKVFMERKANKLCSYL